MSEVAAVKVKSEVTFNDLEYKELLKGLKNIESTLRGATNVGFAQESRNIWTQHALVDLAQLLKWVNDQ